MTTGSGAVRGDVFLLVGTRTGGFMLSSDTSRREWSLAGPYSASSEVFHFVYDPREGGRTIAAVNQMVWGPEIQITEDLESTWLSGKGQPRFLKIPAERLIGFGTSNRAGKANPACYTLGPSLPPFLGRRTTAIPGMRLRGFPTIQRGINGNPDWAGFVSIAWCLIRVIMTGSGLGFRPWVFSTPWTAAIPGRP